MRVGFRREFLKFILEKRWNGTDGWMVFGYMYADM